MEYDIVIIGAGIAGLSTAIKIKQLCNQNNQELSVCILEKGSEVGAHIISGAVFESSALELLYPNWQELGAPLNTKVNNDEFYFLTKNNKFKLPIPKFLHNSGNYIISLANLCRWLGDQAESLGIDIYPGFSASDVIIENNIITGIKTSAFGLDKNNNPTDNYQESIKIKSKQLVLAEGARGSLTKQIIKKFNLDKNSNPQTYGLGIKEIWELPDDRHKEGLVIHTVGWPLKSNTYGGSFMYHMDNNQIALGLVVGLNYKNPYLSPYNEFQKFKLHPFIKSFLENSERISYGARALNEGGVQSLPKLTFPGGLIIGCAAGFMNNAKIKGSHNALKSGIIAAECLYKNLTNKSSKNNKSFDFNNLIKESDIHKELYKIRNIKPAFKFGLPFGMIHAALNGFILKGFEPWTLKYKYPDYLSLKLASKSKPIKYPKPDNKITFDILSSVALTNTHHEENQPCHLKLLDPSKAIKINYNQYNGPEQYYCPAKVYEYLTHENGTKYLQINAANCIHCKTCDIKDPMQNINWTPPEGGGGPNYGNT
tara:strand:- start:73876 stop:75495 length:1620 start_codon:yes stop_codon:yes gene_type:complete